MSAKASPKEGRGPRPRLVLASASPRRAELLRSLGLDFSVRPVDLDESRLGGEEPRSYVLRLATAKAETDAAAGEIHLAADTIVVIDGEVLGKPRDAAEAGDMLRALAGRAHEVLTGVATHATDTGATECGVASTRVWIRGLSPSEIDWYVGTTEPMDKAGAYAIQGLGALLVDRIEGNYTNVVGLPLPLVRELLLAGGWSLTDFRQDGADPAAP